MHHACISSVVTILDLLKNMSKMFVVALRNGKAANQLPSAANQLPSAPGKCTF